MKELKITTLIKEASYDELDETTRNLIDSAKKATDNAYAPYSGFFVGAAILLDNGRIVSGSNQENAAYPSGLCAERTTAFYAAANFPGQKFKKIAVAARTKKAEPDTPAWEESFQGEAVSPCGGCRQALLEYEKLHGNIEVILYGRDKVLIFPSVASLLPYSFTDFNTQIR